MISRLALSLAQHFARRKLYDQDKIHIYKYGFELLLSTLITLKITLLISLVLGVFINTLMFCVAFIAIRSVAGGYHAKSHWECITYFQLVLLLFYVVHRSLSTELEIVYSLLAMVISFLLIACLAPVEATNKPLKPEQKEQLRKKSIAVSVVNLFIGFLLFFVDSNARIVSIFAYYSSGALAASLSLIVAKI